MSRLTLTSLRRQANLITSIQISFVLVLAVVFFLVRGSRAAFAVVLGGAAYILPGYFYAVYLLGNVSSRAVMRIMLIFYLGEALKLLLSVCFFVVFFYTFSLPLLPYFLGYLVAAFAFFLAAVIVMNRTSNFL